MGFANKVGYLYRGSYHKLLTENIYPFFSKKQVYIMIQERMKKDLDSELNKLYGFLGVAEYHLGVRKVTAAEATDRKLDLDLDGKKNFYKKWKSKYPPMNPDVKRRLMEYYKFPNKKLFDLIGPISEWS